MKNPAHKAGFSFDMQIMNFWWQSPEIPTSWKTLDGTSDIASIIQSSNKQTVVFFKHSTRCSRSLYALERLSQGYDISPFEAEFYFLDLLKFRGVSDQVASVCGIQHQSPQIIVLKQEKVIDHFSHESISLERLRSTMNRNK